MQQIITNPDMQELWKALRQGLPLLLVFFMGLGALRAARPRPKDVVRSLGQMALKRVGQMALVFAALAGLVLVWEGNVYLTGPAAKAGLPPEAGKFVVFTLVFVGGLMLFLLTRAWAAMLGNASPQREVNDGDDDGPVEAPVPPTATLPPATDGLPAMATPRAQIVPAAAPSFGKRR